MTSGSGGEELVFPFSFSSAAMILGASCSGWHTVRWWEATHLVLDLIVRGVGWSSEDF